jgi:hypothetical protein
MHVPSLIQAEEAEEIGVEHLLRDISSFSSTSSLSSRVSAQLSALKGLHSRLIDIRDYLAKVLSGEMEVNHQIIYNLQDVFNLLPASLMGEGGGGMGVGAGGEGSATGGGSTEIEKGFRVATNDQMLVVYLSSLIRAVIALHNLSVLPPSSSTILLERGVVLGFPTRSETDCLRFPPSHQRRQQAPQLVRPSPKSSRLWLFPVVTLLT